MYVCMYVCMYWFICLCVIHQTYHVYHSVPVHHKSQPPRRIEFLHASPHMWIPIHMLPLPHRLCDMTHSYMWHDSFTYVTRLIDMWRDWFICDMTYSHVWYDACCHCHTACVASLIHIREMTHSHMRHDSFICDITDSYVTWLVICEMTYSRVWFDACCHCHTACVTWPIQISDMIRSHTWHNSFICDITDLHVTRRIHVWHDVFTRVTWCMLPLPLDLCNMRNMIHSHMTYHIHMCDITHSHVWHDSFTYVTWLILMCDVTHSQVWHDSFICVAWLLHTCDMTHSRVWHDSFTCVTWPSHVWDMT